MRASVERCSDFPLLFYGCSSAHTLAKVDPTSAHPSNSYINVTEAEKVVDLIQSLLGHDTEKGPAINDDYDNELAPAAEAGDDSGDAAVNGGAAGGGDAGGGGGNSSGSGSGESGGGESGGGASPGGSSRVRTSDLGVVTPFRAQVVHIRQRLRKAGLGAVNVGTVDDFQGQEQLIVIISTVIGSANPRSVTAMSHKLMSSAQRFNVAITRAKALLVIVGA